MNLNSTRGKSVLALVAAGLVVAVAAGAFGFLALRGDDDEPADYMGAVITSEPVEMPAAVLTDQDGEPFDLRKETDGYVTLVFVGYTHCPDICPTHMLEISQAFKRLPKDVTDEVKVVFATADPERDTPEVLKDYLALFNPDFIGLTGTREETDAFQKSLGVPVATRTDIGGGNYTVNHAAYVIAFTKEQLAYTVYPGGMGLDEWMNDLPLLVERGFDQ